MLFLPAGGVLLSAVLTYFAFPNVLFHEGFPGLAWAALVPFFWTLEDRPLRQRFALGCLWGGVTFALLTRWMLEVGWGGFVMFVLALSLAPAIFSMMSGVRLRSSTLRMGYWACAWAFSEWLRTLVMGGFAWSLAYSQASVSSLIQLAAVGGVYAVSWVVVCVNGALYMALRAEGRRRYFYLAAAASIFMLNFLAGSWRQSGLLSGAESIRISLIQPNISRADKSDASLYDNNVARHLALTKKAALRDHPVLIVWPETAFPDDVQADFKWRPRIEMLARNYQSYFLVGSALEQDGRSLNSALLLSPRGEWDGTYTKMQLVPFTEYLPADSLSRGLAGLMHIKPYDFVAGKSWGLLSVIGGWKGLDSRTSRFGVAICSEEAYPGIFRQLARREAEFVVVMLNDGWFRPPEALYMHAQNAALRAVESGRSVVRVANTGRTAAFDRAGRLVRGEYPGLQAAGFASVDLPLDSHSTPYVYWGDIFAWLCGGFVIISLVVAWLDKRGEACRR